MSMQGAGAGTASPANIRMFIRAGSAEELVRAQLQVNLLLKGQANFTDIQNVEGQWYAWFLIDVNKHHDVIQLKPEGTPSPNYLYKVS